MRLLALALLLSAALPAASLAPEPEAPAALVWLARVAGRSALSAVAFEGRTGRLAAGDARGVLVGPAAGQLAPVATRAPVLSLAFAPDGALLVGTEEGLFALDAQGSLTDRSPGVGDEARRIERLASAAGLTAAATSAGLYLSLDGRHWQRAPGPRGAIAVSLWRSGSTAQVICVASGDVFAASLELGGEALSVGALAPVPGLEASIRAGAVDVSLGEDGALVIVTPDRLAYRPVRAAGFRVLRPTLPPGASVFRAAAAAGQFWLGTDRGLLSATTLEGPFTRAGSALPATPVRDLAGDEARIFAATESGLLEGALANVAAPVDAVLREARIALEFPGRREPPVDAVFRAALEYLDLRPELIRKLRRGLSLRGLLPELSFRLQRGRSSDGESSLDESFVSGDTRRLLDVSRGNERETIASVTLAWELGDVAYDAEAVDLSREARSVIQLRDDVLDEISQLYFERRRLLLQLAALGPAAADADAERLRLRADELAAGLDAWTGGWFGSQAPPLAR